MNSMYQELKSQLINQNCGQQSTSTLKNEIKRLNGIIQLKDRQIKQKNQIISSYITQLIKQNQKFCLILMLNSKIQRLKNKISIIESQQQNKSQILKRQYKNLNQQSQDVPNFDIIREFQECLRNLYSFYQNHKQQQKIQQNLPLKSPTNSLETNQTFKSSQSIIQSFPSSTSLAQSFTLNSRKQKQENSQHNQFPLYTPIKTQKQTLSRLSKLDDCDSLKHSTNSFQSSKEKILFSQSAEKQNQNSIKNSQNNNLSFLSYWKFKPQNNFSIYENKNFTIKCQKGIK